MAAQRMPVLISTGQKHQSNLAEAQSGKVVTYRGIVRSRSPGLHSTRR